MEIDQKKYEIGFLSDSETGNDDIKKILQDHGAEITEESPLSRIKLAYPIKKETFAYFGYVQFFAAPDAIIKIKDDLKFVKTILRSLIVAHPVSPTKEARESEIASRELSAVPAESETRPKKPSKVAVELSNEELEKKLEEILN